MKGKYNILIQNNVLQYRFEIRRNITIIKGDSATGKTTLVEMVREYYENGEQSGVNLQCEKTCVVLEGRQWKVLLENIHDSIIFIDEGNQFVSTNEFALAVKRSDNYFVIATREALPNLPYSVEEIYGIKSSGKYGTLKQTYHEFYRIYGQFDYNTAFHPEILLVEDSNSGYEFFEAVAEEKDWEVVSAGGKSNIFKLIKENEESDLIKDNSIHAILDNPSEYIESEDYMSWERYFTALLTDKTKDTYLQYSKSKLNESYKSKKVKDAVLKEIPEQLL